ncbi:DUF2142 domain-containing protein [Paraburkholderia sp. RL17-383-BIF-A]|uniref:DUF2142 domain-containing protein n=1 Tax=Paraburkholderia sp. RL17-383-BIF-A TaxID=3031631 RepID=UPI0038BC0F9F
MPVLNQLVRIIEGQRLHLLYLCFALPLGFFLIVATPPFQTPDAVNHFYRVIQISEGHLLGEKLGATSGGPIDGGAIAFSRLFDPIAAHPEVKVTAAMLAVANGQRWTNEIRIAEFPNTAIYPAYAYLPQALGVKIGQMFRMTVRNTLMVVCALGLAMSIALTCWALAIGRRTRPLIFATALLPSTLMIFSSVSQEVSVFPVCFLLIAYLERFLSERWKLDARKLVIAGLALILCISARPPYAGLLLIIFCPALRVGRDGQSYGLWQRAVWCAAVGLVAIVATTIFGNAAWAPVPPPRSVAGQVAFLLHAPLNIPSIAIATFRQNATLYYQSFVGILGWLDAYMSPGYYRAAAVMLMFALVSTVLQPSLPEGKRAADRATIAVSILTCVGMIFGSLYLTWTPVGQQVVEGVQGRYFLALFPLFGLALPNLIARGRDTVRAFRIVEQACLLGVSVFPAYTFVDLVRAIIVRYYLH